MPSSRAVNLAASIGVLSGRKLSEEVIRAWSVTIEAGVDRWNLTYDELGWSLEELSTEAERISPASLLTRARTQPAEKWLAILAEKRQTQKLLGGEDTYFEAPIPYPQDFKGEVRTTPRERARLDVAYATWRHGDTARDWKKKQDDHRSRASAFAHLPQVK